MKLLQKLRQSAHDTIQSLVGEIRYNHARDMFFKALTEGIEGLGTALHDSDTLYEEGRAALHTFLKVMADMSEHNFFMGPFFRTLRTNQREVLKTQLAYPEAVMRAIDEACANRLYALPSSTAIRLAIERLSDLEMYFRYGTTIPQRAPVPILTGGASPHSS